MAWSGQEAIAYNAGFDDGVFGRPKNNPYDVGVVPRSFTAYEEGYAEGSISTLPPRGAAGPKGDQGDQGPPGQPGTPGAPGDDGSSTLTGIGPPPPSLGNNGDTYIDSATGDFYLKTGTDTWTFQSRLGDVTLAVNLDDVGGDPQVLYRGEAAPGTPTNASLWRIQRITINGDDVVIEWADGNANFDNVFDNRLILSYS